MLGRGPKTKKMCLKPYGLPALFALAILSSGCATNQYMGISLQPGGADPLVQTLAVKAQGGDKRAQYELGRRFEDSTDPNGLKKAIKLYRQAAIDGRGPLWVYTPSPGGGAPGRVIQVGNGLYQNGLAEAQARLRSLTANAEQEND